MYKLNFIIHNWKLIIDLLFGTFKFGVNNQWWCQFSSLFGIPWWKRTPRQILLNYRAARFRACTCYFVQYPKKLFKNYLSKSNSIYTAARSGTHTREWET